MGSNPIRSTGVFKTAYSLRQVIFELYQNSQYGMRVFEAALRYKQGICPEENPSITIFCHVSRPSMATHSLEVICVLNKTFTAAKRFPKQSSRKKGRKSRSDTAARL